MLQVQVTGCLTRRKVESVPLRLRQDAAQMQAATMCSAVFTASPVMKQLLNICSELCGAEDFATLIVEG